LVDSSSSASMFVINLYRSRTSESIFSVKLLFGSNRATVQLCSITGTYIEWLMWILGATFRLTVAESHSMKHERHQPHVVRDVCWLSWEWSAQQEESGGQPFCHIPIRRNQPRKFEIVVLKWVVTNGRNPKRQASRTSRLHWACCLP
jgi:hypothetical protein